LLLLSRKLGSVIGTPPLLTVRTCAVLGTDWPGTFHYARRSEYVCSVMGSGHGGTLAPKPFSPVIGDPIALNPQISLFIRDLRIWSDANFLSH
jgi:hypothetical protein